MRMPNGWVLQSLAFANVFSSYRVGFHIKSMTRVTHLTPLCVSRRTSLVWLLFFMWRKTCSRFDYLFQCLSAPHPGVSIVRRIWGSVLPHDRNLPLFDPTQVILNPNHTQIWEYSQWLLHLYLVPRIRRWSGFIRHDLMRNIWHVMNGRRNVCTGGHLNQLQNSSKLLNTFYPYSFSGLKSQRLSHPKIIHV